MKPPFPPHLRMWCDLCYWPARVWRPLFHRRCRPSVSCSTLRPPSTSPRLSGSLHLLTTATILTSIVIWYMYIIKVHAVLFCKKNKITAKSLHYRSPEVCVFNLPIEIDFNPKTHLSELTEKCNLILHEQVIFCLISCHTKRRCYSICTVFRKYVNMMKGHSEICIRYQFYQLHHTHNTLTASLRRSQNIPNCLRCYHCAKLCRRE